MSICFRCIKWIICWCLEPRGGTTSLFWKSQGLCTLSPFSFGRIFWIRNLKKTNKQTKKGGSQKLRTLSLMLLFFYLLWKLAVRDKMKSSSSEDDFVALWLLKKKKKKILGSSNPESKTRTRRVSPTDKWAVDTSRSLPGVFQNVSSPVWYAASCTGTTH